MRFPIALLLAALVSLLWDSSAVAHHGAFYKAVFRAVENGDVDSIKHLFSEPAWEGDEGAMSAAELQTRLKKGQLISPRGNAAAHFRLFEYSSYGEKISSRCLVAFKLRFSDEKDRGESIFLLAKRVDFSNNTNRNPKAWQVWRIVNDHQQAVSFVGREMPRFADREDTESQVSTEDDAKLYQALGRVVAADAHPSLKEARAELLAELRKRYAGKISGQTEIGSKEAADQSRRMSELMRLWNPIGFSARDVKSVLGRPTHEWRRGERSSFTSYAGFQYAFDFGSSGSYWQFTVEGETVEPDSTVSGVRHIPGE